MNKDALLATAIGFFIGLCITGILLVGPSVLKKLPKFSLPAMPAINKNAAGGKNPSPTAPAESTAFAVTSPLGEAIESENSLLVSGTAAPHATIVIQGNTDDAVVETSSDGKFAGKITLSEGRNDIVVTSYIKNVPSTKNLTVYYTPETL